MILCYRKISRILLIARIAKMESLQYMKFYLCIPHSLAENSSFLQLSRFSCVYCLAQSVTNLWQIIESKNSKVLIHIYFNMLIIFIIFVLSTLMGVVAAMTSALIPRGMMSYSLCFARGTFSQQKVDHKYPLLIVILVTGFFSVMTGFHCGTFALYCFCNVLYCTLWMTKV